MSTNVANAADVLVFENARIRQPPPGMQVTAGYVTIKNVSSSDVEIQGVSSEFFGVIEIHQSSVVDGVAKMNQLETLKVPANDSVSLEPGSFHLMLFSPEAALTIGNLIKLHFQTELGAIEVEFTVHRE